MVSPTGQGSRKRAASPKTKDLGTPRTAGRGLWAKVGLPGRLTWRKMTMKSTRWYGRDTELTVRMGLTLLLLVLLYMAFLVVLWRITGSAAILVVAGGAMVL